MMTRTDFTLRLKRAESEFAVASLDEDPMVTVARTQSAIIAVCIEAIAELLGEKE